MAVMRSAMSAKVDVPYGSTDAILPGDRVGRGPETAGERESPLGKGIELSKTTIRPGRTHHTADDHGLGDAELQRMPVAHVDQ
jgi:hypothetical protein